MKFIIILLAAMIACGIAIKNAVVSTIDPLQEAVVETVDSVDELIESIEMPSITIDSIKKISHSATIEY